MLKNYFKIALRNILKLRNYSLINIIGFSISLVPVILFVLYINYELSYDKHNENYDQVYRVVGKKGPIMPTPLAEALEADLEEVEYAIRIRNSKEKLVCNKNIFFEKNVLFADKDIFNVFTFEFLLGNSSLVFKDNYSIVVSESKAQKYFGNNNPIGKTINYRGIYDLVVTGVFKDLPNSSHFKADFIIPSYFLDMSSGSFTMNSSSRPWGMNMFYTYLLLRKDVNTQTLASHIKGIIATSSGKEDLYSHEQYSLQALSGIHLHSNYFSELEKNGSIKQVYLYISLALITLLIAIINYVNLATARYSQRTREIGIRKIIGARRKQLIVQLLIETLVISLAAFSITVVVVSLILPTFNQFVNREIPLNFLSDLNIFVLLIPIVLVTTFVSGLYPAIIISSIKPDSITGGKVFIKKSKLRNLLIVIQFTLSLSLIYLTTVIIKQNDFILNKDLGYDRENVFIVKLSKGKKLAELEAIKTEMLRNSDIINVSSSTNLPNQSFISSSLKTFNNNDSLKMRVNYNFVDFNYTELYGIQLLEGRNFKKDISFDNYESVVLSKSAVKALSWEEPLGKFINLVTPYGADIRKVIGVVEDFHMHSLHKEITPFYFAIDKDLKHYNLSIKVRPENIIETTKNIKNICSSFFKGEDLKYSFFDEEVQKQYSEELKAQNIFYIFSFFALLVACFGLYGLISFSVENRQKEIGIRKVLGASSFKIGQNLLYEFLILVVLGVILSIPLSIFTIDAWLSNFVYQTEVGVSVFILPTFSILVIAVLTMLIQIYKASTTNPVESLRNE